MQREGLDSTSHRDVGRWGSPGSWGSVLMCSHRQKLRVGVGPSWAGLGGTGRALRCLRGVQFLTGLTPGVQRAPLVLSSCGGSLHRALKG